jgi:hypothetical protein
MFLVSEANKQLSTSSIQQLLQHDDIPDLHPLRWLSMALIIA